MNIQARAQQHKALQQIFNRPNSPDLNATDVTDIYRFETRRILVTTEILNEDLDLNNGAKEAAVGDGVDWLGISCLEEDALDHSYLPADKTLIAQISSVLSVGAFSLLHGLTKLELGNFSTPLAALKTVLMGCPNLKSLTCGFNKGDETYLSNLGELLSTHGSGLHLLNVNTFGADILAFLPHITICPSLKLRGLIEVETWRECDVPSSIDSPTRQLVLEPWIWQRKVEVMPLAYLPPAYDWSQRVMEIIPRACKIYLEGNLRSEYRAWSSVVSDRFRSSRDPENRSKPDPPGWTKRDRAAY